MKIEQFLCFNEVKKLRSFSKAADALFLSQSSLSKQIRSLETELGEALFVRRRNAVQLTAMGQHIAPYVEEIAAAYSKLIAATEAYAPAKTQEILKLTTFFNMGACTVGRAMVAFEHRRPNFHIETLECSHSQMSTYMKTDSSMVFIGCREFLQLDDRFAEIPLTTNPLALVVNSAHPLARSSSIRLSEARNERFCFPREDPELFLYYLNNCAQNGFTPFLTHSDVRLTTIQNYIGAGMRCTIQIKDIAEFYFSDPKFKVLEIEDVSPLTLSLIYSKDNDAPLVHQFAKFMHEYFSEPQEL